MSEKGSGTKIHEAMEDMRKAAENLKDVPENLVKIAVVENVPKPKIIDTAEMVDGVLTYKSTGKPVRVCIDADCPQCGWVERWYDFGLEKFGCNKCDYLSTDREA